MKLLILFIAWCILFVLAWPVALVVLAVAPVIWLLTLALRVAVLCVSAVFALLSAILFLPARVLGYRRHAA